MAFIGNPAVDKYWGRADNKLKVYFASENGRVSILRANNAKITTHTCRSTCCVVMGVPKEIVDHVMYVQTCY